MVYRPGFTGGEVPADMSCAGGMRGKVSSSGSIPVRQSRAGRLRSFYYTPKRGGCSLDSIQFKIGTHPHRLAGQERDICSGVFGDTGTFLLEGAANHKQQARHPLRRGHR